MAVFGHSGSQAPQLMHSEVIIVAMAASRHTFPQAAAQARDGEAGAAGNPRSRQKRVVHPAPVVVPGPYEAPLGRGAGASGRLGGADACAVRPDLQQPLLLRHPRAARAATLHARGRGHRDAAWARAASDRHARGIPLRACEEDGRGRGPASADGGPALHVLAAEARRQSQRHGAAHRPVRLRGLHHHLAPTALRAQREDAGLAPRSVSPMTRRLLGTLCALLVSAPLGMARAQFDPDFNHLECYSIKPAQKFMTRTVTVETQFGVHTAVEVKKPARLCLPADKTGPGVDPLPPTALPHFLCYKVKTKVRFPADVRLTDQFGTLRERTKKAQLLCTPVVKVGPTTTTTSTTTTSTTTTSTTPP